MRPRLLKILCLCASATLLSSGCGRRVVLVPPGEPVRLAQPTKTTIYVRTGDGWVKGSNSVTLPEGWYALPMPDEDK